MALTTVNASKEGGYQPLLLATFVFADGSTLKASTHNLSAGEGGNQYSGADYLARIDSQDISQIQARSEQGIDRVSDVTLRLYNADQYLLLNYEMASGKGFKGAILTLALVLMDIDPSTGLYVFSTDSPAPFRFKGICDAPDKAPSGGQFLSIRATTAHNLGRVDLPQEHVGQRCGNVFPRNAAERLAGATDMSSWQWGCGYDPDQAGTDPEIGGSAERGNTTSANLTDAQGNVISDGSGVYIRCNYTKADCVLRGMYSADSSSRATGRFTGEQWGPSVAEGQYKSYTAGKNITAFSSRNENIYSRSYPLVDGAQWIKNPIVLNVLGDGNATRFEVALCSGDVGVDGVDLVIVNGIIIPENTPGNYPQVDALERWNFCDGSAFSSTHTGSRNGIATADAGYNSLGDPHGGHATIEVVVHTELAQSNSVPSIQVRLRHGPKIITYSGGVRSLQFSKNYAWCIYDKLIWSKYSFAELDTASFEAAAAICAGSVSYVDLNGVTQSHARFICEQAIEDRTKANEVTTAMLRGCRGMLAPNSDTGLLQLFIRQTLADQQPSAVAGSNYNTAILSVTAANTTANGFVAYLIDESVILQDGKGSPLMEGPFCVPNAQAPNSIVFPFQDADNGYQDDSISVVDPDDVARSAGYQLGGAQIPAGYTVRGVSSFDHGIRTANVILAEGFRGNPGTGGIPDTRGTYIWQPTATSRVSHLRAGHICLLRFQAQALQPGVQLQSPPGIGIAGILVRVEAIKPASNYERAVLTLKWHEDRWYTDKYGQSGTPGYSDPRQGLPDRPPFPWRPFGQQPVAGDSIYSTSEWSFSAALGYGLTAGGIAIPQLSIGGCPPVNSLSSGANRVQPPFMPTQASTANTGGTIPGALGVKLAIAAQDADGHWSALSSVASVVVPSATNTNTVTTPTIAWQPGTIAWALFGGIGHHTLSNQSSGSGTPSTITITSLNVSTYGPPDPLADSVLVEVKKVFHGGVFGDACQAVASLGGGSGTIQFLAATFATSQFNGYRLSLYANAIGDESPVPIIDFLVASHTATVLTVSPDPVAVGIVPGCVFVMRAKPGSDTDANHLGDVNYASSYAPTGFDPSVEIGRELEIKAGKGRGQRRTISSVTTDSFGNWTILGIDHPWHTIPDATSVPIVSETTWQSAPVAKISNAALTQSPVPIVSKVDIQNYAKQSIMVRASVLDQAGNSSVRRWAPERDLYVWGGGGTRGVTAATDTQLPTDGTILFDTSGISGTTTTLSAAITSTSTNSISVTSGAAIVNGTVISCGTERMFVDAGGGTASLTVIRGFGGTTAATHLISATVNVPGSIVETLLPIGSVPNLKLVLAKTSSDINYVLYQAAPATTDLLPGGGTTAILPDNSADRGTVYIQAPG